MSDSFLPTAAKFHYQWNLRELSAVTQGLCASTRDEYEQPMMVARLWLHEVSRVYGDRLVSEQDCARFGEQALRTSQSFFEDLEQEALHARPLAYVTFASPHSDEKTYLPLVDGARMRKLLEAKLLEYNEQHQRMDLVLFEQALPLHYRYIAVTLPLPRALRAGDGATVTLPLHYCYITVTLLVLFEQAMEHVCRVSRIIGNPRGNALLVGVGGSGKQSLSRLAAFIGGHAVFQIKLTQGYSMTDFRQDVFALYSSTGATPPHSAVTLPLQCRYLAVTLPLHYRYRCDATTQCRYLAVTLPLHYRYRYDATTQCRYLAVTLPLPCRYIAVTLP